MAFPFIFPSVNSTPPSMRMCGVSGWYFGRVFICGLSVVCCVLWVVGCVLCVVGCLLWVFCCGFSVVCCRLWAFGCRRLPSTLLRDHGPGTFVCLSVLFP